MTWNSGPGGVWPDERLFECAGVDDSRLAHQAIVTPWVRSVRGDLVFEVPVPPKTTITCAHLRHPSPTIEDPVIVHLPTVEYFERAGTFMITASLTMGHPLNRDDIDQMFEQMLIAPQPTSEEQEVLEARKHRRLARESTRTRRVPRVDLYQKEIESR